MGAPDRKFFLWCLAGAMWLAAAPWLIGWSLTPRGAEYYGNKIIAPADFSIYYSYINQGRDGRLAMYDAFTSEPHPATLIQPVWLAVGQLAKLTNLSAPAAFALARFLAVPLLIYVLWWAAGWVWPDNTQRRRLGFGLSILAGGLGGIATAVGPRLADFPWTYPDLWVSEAYTVLTLWSGAHFILVTSGIIFVLIAVERSWLERRWSWAWWAGLTALLVFSVHPFHLVTWLTLWLLMTCWRWLANRRFPREYVARWVTVLAIGSPALLLYGLQLLFDPLTIGRATQNINQTPSPWVMAIGLGLPLIGAVAGGCCWRPRDERWRWAMGLAAAYLVAIYLPLPFQRRLSQGLMVPLAWLSVPVTVAVLDAVRRRMRVILPTAMIAGALVLASSWLLVGGLVVKDYADDLVIPRRMYFVDSEHLELMSFVRTTDRHQPILATLLEGNLMAGLTAHQVYVGYGVETLNFGDKMTNMNAFFSRLTAGEQRRLLAREQLCYVLTSPRSRAYGDAFRPEQWTDLERVWSGRTLALYRTPYCR
ncbi:MAG: hypothetical protein AAB402_02770 [Patescibacteria group bacterium]